MHDPQSPTPEPGDAAPPNPNLDSAQRTTLTFRPDAVGSVRPAPEEKTEPDRKLETIQSARPEPSPASDSTIDQPPPLPDTLTPQQLSKVDTSFSLAGVVPQPARTQYQEVAGYEILQVLGRGAMGVVYKARQRNLKRLVALKMVLAGEHASREDMARFHTEAMAAAELKHPNIVQVYELGEHNGLPFLSLEYVDGGSLKDKLKGRLPLAPKPAALLMQVLAHAMDHAHRHNIIHRDLKPANVLLAVSEEQAETLQRTVTGSPVSFKFNDVYWIPKIADFGLAKRLEASDEQTSTGTVLGTAMYMPPEQAEGRSKDVGPLGDQYALGVILYEFLTGQPPFHGDTVWETLEQVRKQEPLPPSRLQPRLPRDLEIVCLKCLQKDPHKRYESTAALAEDLRRFLAGEPIKARPVTNVERFARWCRRNPRVAMLTGAVFFLLLSATIGALSFAYVLNDQKNATEIARQLAEKNEQTATEKKEEAQKAQAVAKTQAQLALRTFGKLATGVQDKLKDTAATHDLRKELLQVTIDGLKEVMGTDEKNNALLQDRTLAAALLRMGKVFEEMGKTEEALPYYKRVHDVLKALADANPESDKNRGNLAVSLTALGDISLTLQSPSAAKEYYLKALRLRAEIVEHPRSKDLSPAEARESLLNSYEMLCDLSNSTEEKEGFAQKALQLISEMSRQDPNNLRVKLALASSNRLLGDLKLQQGNIEAARAFHQKRLAICEQLSRQRPDSITAKRNLAMAHEAVGDDELILNQEKSAEQEYEIAVAIYQKLALADADNVTLQNALALAHYRLGTAYHELGDAASSQKNFEASLKWREAWSRKHPADRDGQSAYMVTLARCGQHQRAADIAKRLAREGPSEGANLFQVACCYALCSAAFGNGKRGQDLTAEENKLRQEYLDRAFTTLWDAVAHGYQLLANIQTDPDLDPIRHSAKYANFIKEVKKSLAQRGPVHDDRK